MSFPEKGQKAKYGNVIGIVHSVEGETVTLKFHRRWAQPTFEEAPLSELTHVCQETVFKDYSSNECGRPVKEGNLCGVHNGAKKRRENQRAKWAAEAEAAQLRREELRKVKARMEQKLADKGLTDKIVSLNENHETVTVNLDTLLDLLRNA